VQSATWSAVRAEESVGSEGDETGDESEGTVRKLQGEEFSIIAFLERGKRKTGSLKKSGSAKIRGGRGNFSFTP